MRKNMGTADKAIRLFIAGVIALLYFTGLISGTLAIVAGIVALVLILTSFLNFCPLYLPFGINTCKKSAPKSK